MTTGSCPARVMTTSSRLEASAHDPDRAALHGVVWSSRHPRVRCSGLSELRNSFASKRAPTEATPAVAPAPASMREAASTTRGAVTA